MNMIESPSPNGSNGGRNPGGRFGKGNKGGPGNPFAAKVAKLRTAMLRSVSPADMKAIIGKLVEEAKGGNVQAAKEVLERCLGKPFEADLMERLEKMEAALAAQAQEH